MRKYEIMYIIDQDATDVKAVSKKLNDILTADGGKIIESAEWGLKDFAYEINHKKKGHYFIVIVDTTPANITEFQRISGIDKEVVRTLVINTETEKKYVQSTKVSKTDMSKFKEERKSGGRNFDRRGPRSNDSYSEGYKSEEKRDAASNDTVKKDVVKKVESEEKKDIVKKTVSKTSEEK